MVYLVHVLDEVENLVGITPLVIVPGDNLNEGVGEGDTCARVEDAGAGIGEEVGGNNGILGVAQNALQLAFGGGLHSGANFIVLCGLLQVYGQVDNGNVKGGNSHGHTGELAVEAGDYLAYCLGGAGGAGDDVAAGCAAAAPILYGGAVNGTLRSGNGVDSGHKTVLDAPVIVENLGERSKAVSGAGSIGNVVHVLGVSVVVYAHDEHGGIVLGRSGHDDLLCAGGQMGSGLLLGEELAGTLGDVFNAPLAPVDVVGVAVAAGGDLLAVDDDGVVGVIDICVKNAVHGVVLEQISHIIGGYGTVDAGELDIFVVEACAQNESADASEAVNAYFN